MENNSHSPKIIGIVVIVVIILAGVWYMAKRPGMKTEDVKEQTSSEAQAPATPAVDPAIAGITASGSANANLEADASAMDAQMNDFSADNASAQSATVE